MVLPALQKVEEEICVGPEEDGVWRGGEGGVNVVEWGCRDLVDLGTGEVEVGYADCGAELLILAVHRDDDGGIEEA
jgi:hypothetical protein